jgi:hypothetical protein
MLSLDETNLERRSLARNDFFLGKAIESRQFILSKKGGCGWTGAHLTDAH